MNNIVRPIIDPFWNSYYPPNGWRCHCDVMQTDDDDVTDDYEAPSTDEVPDEFLNNPGKIGEVFTESHPFFNAVSAEQAHNVLNSMRKFSVSNESSYSKIKKSADVKNAISAHFDADAKDIYQHMIYAEQFLNDAKNVKILPRYSNPKGVKWPDLKLNENTLIEVKGIVTKSEDALLDRALSASSQLKKNIYNIENGFSLIEVDGFTDGQLKRFLLRYFGKSKRDKIFIYRNDKIYEFKRGEWFTFD